MNISWAFLRNSWNTCGKTREFLGSHEVQIEWEVNARKERIEAEAAWEKFAQAEMIYVVNGRKILDLPPTDENKETILDKAIGRSGNLRAPTIQVGNQFVVGFNEELYNTLLVD